MSANWPDVIFCENSSCGRKIHTVNDKFTLVNFTGNVQFNSGGHKKNGNISHVLCDRCTRNILNKMKRKNKLLDGVNMKTIAAAILMFVMAFFSVGCANMGVPVNPDLAQKNDSLVKQTVADNDNLRSYLSKTLKGDTSWNKDEQGNPVFDENISKSMAIRNDSAKKVAAELLENSKALNPGK